MTICPIAIAVGCKKCPVFKVCPLKTSLGDAPKEVPAKPVAVARPARGGAARKPGAARKASRSSKK